MNISKVNLNTQVDFETLEEVNSSSVVNDAEKFAKVEDYEKTLINDINLNSSLMNKNLQTEVSKLQVAKQNLLEQGKALEKTRAELEKFSGNDLEIANKSVVDLVNNIGSISERAVFDGVNLFETESSYDSGKFRVPSINVGGKNYLRYQSMDVSTTEDLTNAMTIIERAIDKINNEVTLCDGSIDFLIDKVTFTSNLNGNIANATVAKETLKSLKQRMFVEAQNLKKVQLCDFDISSKLLD